MGRMALFFKEKENVGDCKTVALQLKMIKNDDKLFAKISENAEKLYHELTDWDT